MTTRTGSPRPNLLVILDDQHRHDYLGCVQPFVRTPHIDALAARGLRLTQCTTSAPVCAPARIGLASGFAPSRYGALDNNAFLPATATPYYARLRDAGYRVGCVGKLDLAKPDQFNGLYGDRPRVFGWGFTHPEECEGKMHAGISPTPIGPYSRWLEERGLLTAFHEDYEERRADWVRQCHDSVLPAEAFEDSYIARRAAEWIASIGADTPWHLFVSFVGPHDPFDPPTTYADRWRTARVPSPVRGDGRGKPRWVRDRDLGLTPEEAAVTRRQYCAAIEAIDDGVGAILAALEARGWTQDTVVVFASDHGEMLGDHGLYTKSVAYEAALRVPLIAAGPGVRAGTTSDALAELIDLNPTLCELAGLQAQPGIDARSLAPLLAGDTEAHREEAVGVLRNFRCVRTRRWKWIDNINDGDELYDLEVDPDELVNVATEHAAVVGELRGRLRQRLAWDPQTALS